jgi:hypothetical protein
MVEVSLRSVRKRVASSKRRSDHQMPCPVAESRRINPCCGAVIPLIDHSLPPLYVASPVLVSPNGTLPEPYWEPVCEFEMKDQRPPPVIGAKLGLTSTGLSLQPEEVIPGPAMVPTRRRSNGRSELLFNRPWHNFGILFCLCPHQHHIDQHQCFLHLRKDLATPG